MSAGPAAGGPSGGWCLSLVQKTDHRLTWLTSAPAGQVKSMSITGLLEVKVMSRPLNQSMCSDIAERRRRAIYTSYRLFTRNTRHYSSDYEDYQTARSIYMGLNCTISIMITSD